MERYASCGRILNRTMTMREICNYLGIESNKSKDFKKEVCKEFGELEKDFKNRDIDFALNTDLKGNDNIYNYKIVKTGKLIDAKVQILEGLYAGEKVIVEGMLSVSDGIKVNDISNPGLNQEETELSSDVKNNL